MATYKNIKKHDLIFSLAKAGDFIIPPDATAELPEGNAHVQTLEASGYIKKIKENTNPSKPKK